MDQLEQRVNEFFTNAKKNKPEWREEQMEIIKKVKNRCSAPQFIQVLLLLITVVVEIILIPKYKCEIFT